MVNDIINSIKVHLSERATSPLFGTFIVSWSLWNIKTLFILFSSMKTIEKFNYITNQIYPSWSEIIYNGIVWPFSITAAIIFAYPYPAKWVYEYWRKRQKELKEIQQKIDDETPLTREESRSIKQWARELERNWDETITKRDEQINQMKQTINKLEEAEQHYLRDADIKISEKNKKIEELEYQVKDQLRQINQQTDEIRNLKGDDLKKEFQQTGQALPDHAFVGEIPRKKYPSQTVKEPQQYKIEELGSNFITKDKIFYENKSLVVKILKTLGEKGSLTFAQIKDSFKDSRINHAIIEYLLNDLENMDLISSDSGIYKLTNKGRTLVIKQQIVR